MPPANHRAVSARPPQIIPPTTLGVLNVTAADIKEFSALQKLGAADTRLPLTTAAVSTSWLLNTPRQQVQSAKCGGSASTQQTTYKRFFDVPPPAALSATLAERSRLQKQRQVPPRSVLPVTAPLEASPRPIPKPPSAAPKKEDTFGLLSKKLLEEIRARPLAPFKPKPYDELDIEKTRNRVQLSVEDRIIARAAYETKLMEAASLTPRRLL